MFSTCMHVLTHRYRSLAMYIIPASVPFIGNLMIERVSFQVVPLHRNSGMNVDSVCLGAIHLSTQPSAYEDLARVVGTGKWFN